MESMVVIIIIGICVAIWGFHGRDHIRISMMTEAKMFIDKVIAQEKMYFADKGNYSINAGTDTGEVEKLDNIYINTKSNKYFKTFKVIRPANTRGTIIVEVYPDTTKYKDMGGYYIRGVFTADKDITEYSEFFG
ncbi:MAG: hypothetical protein K5622_01745 [Endomicrobiaceae bacterium]|nr:hypothetical protein [Endomicrobiaceae bacterium]